ncbi:MAG TPA: DUF6765 family protein [Pyrinomonadaceae bacterium]|nr:DUF6765 family protein [Pyrinomonadaceae bacterium]
MTRNQYTKRIRQLLAVGTTLTIVVALFFSGRVPITTAFNADATTAITGLQQHSSFHYEMVRVLALMAGFSKNEAEEIAVAGEAVDLGTFTGYKLSSGAKTLTVRNTNRFGPNGRFYHFARRSAQYEQAAAPGSKADTCGYFIGGDRKNANTAPCTIKGPELDQIRNWAFALPGPRPNANQLPKNALGKPIQPKSLIALGIYLHAIGDTYSHEQCMIVQSFRFHKPVPPSCNANWHVNYPVGDFGAGLPFTEPAAKEVWRALRQYKGATGSNPPSFIEEFIKTSDACSRVKLAVDTFNSLTGDSSPRIVCPPARADRQGPNKRRLAIVLALLSQ